MNDNLLWQIKKFTNLSSTELYKILQLRAQVFVVEQQSIFLDIDDQDQDAWHICVANSAAQLIAYARIIVPNFNSQTISFGRVCIALEYRRLGLGKQLVSFTIKQIDLLFGNEIKIIISAQTYLIKFYQNFGFKIISDEYLSEDGILHIDMQRVNSLTN